jgi:hypothetical protein
MRWNKSENVGGNLGGNFFGSFFSLNSLGFSRRRGVGFGSGFLGRGVGCDIKLFVYELYLRCV